MLRQWTLTIHLAWSGFLRGNLTATASSTLWSVGNNDNVRALGSLPDYGLARNSKSISVHSTADMRPLSTGQKLITQWKNPEVAVPPPKIILVDSWMHIASFLILFGFAACGRMNVLLHLWILIYDCMVCVCVGIAVTVLVTGHAWFSCLHVLHTSVMVCRIYKLNEQSVTSVGYVCMHRGTCVLHWHIFCHNFKVWGFFWGINGMQYSHAMRHYAIIVQ